jgi:hypothetical protein
VNRLGGAALYHGTADERDALNSVEQGIEPYRGSLGECQEVAEARWPQRGGAASEEAKQTETWGPGKWDSCLFFCPSFFCL